MEERLVNTNTNQGREENDSKFQNTCLVCRPHYACELSIYKEKSQLMCEKLCEQ